MDFIEITINNWTKYNSSKTSKRCWWFKISNRICEDPDLMLLSHEHFRVWIYFLCTASCSCSSQIRISFAHIERIIGANRESVMSLIKYLETIRAVSRIKSKTTRAEHRKKQNLKIALRVGEGEGEGKGKEEREGHLATELPLPQLALIWNEFCGPLPKVKKTNSARSRKAASKIKEHSVDEWREIIQKITASKFCIGNNDRGWKATFDWLLQSETALKVLEGKYDEIQKNDWSWLDEMEPTKEEKELGL